MELRKIRSVGKKALLAGAFGIGGLTLTGCEVAPPNNGFFHALRMGWPEGITPEAHELGNFWVWTWVAAWIIGIIMWGLFFWSLIFFSAKKAEKAGKGEFPRQTQYNIGLELVLTLIPVAIVMTLFFFTVQAQDQATALDKDPKVTVDVTGFQWNWKFGYREIDASLSPTGQDYDGTNEERQAIAEASKKEDFEGGFFHKQIGTDESFLHFDKIETVGTTEEVPVLVLPSRTAIEFDLVGADVVHSFWVPEFLFKRDAFPNPAANMSNNRFQITEIEKEGAFVGRCAEMCGTYHAMMNFEIRVVSPEKFKEYVKFRADNPTAPNSEALKSIGEEPYATSTQPFVTGRTATRGVEPGTNAVDLNAEAK